MKFRPYQEAMMRQHGITPEEIYTKLPDPALRRRMHPEKIDVWVDKILEELMTKRGALEN
ncbi:hypothetical protein HY496_00140 [Candidatus Woesearchaeota archaeon]|nr:hypothetical protein [Candidatus Woesearchaeota archaeon]